MLERLTPHKTPSAVEPDEPTDTIEAEAGRGRGVARKTREAEGRTAKKTSVKGRTIYLPETLFERIMVQAHRKGRTISEYVTGILERQVPDYRTARADPGSEESAA
ncbi:MAG: hypothetical protein JWN86_213 [Planctomycetota bacterium]|nr:hypothetical protein [Planctomycetota bacterium]